METSGHILTCFMRHTCKILNQMMTKLTYYSKQHLKQIKWTLFCHEGNQYYINFNEHIFTSGTPSGRATNATATSLSPGLNSKMPVAL